MQLCVFFAHIASMVKQGGELGEALSLAASLGVTGLDFKYEELRDSENELMPMLRERGMEVSCIYRFYDFPTTPLCEDDLDLYRLAKRVGCRRVMPIACRGSHLEPEATWQAILPPLRRLYDYGKSLGIASCMEDFDNDLSPFHTVAGLSRLMAEAPDCGCTFDTGNFIHAGEDVEAAYEVLRSRIVHVHLKDRLISHDGSGKRVLAPCAVGDGQIPVARILSRLREDGYDGAVSMEFFSVPDYREALIRSAEFVRPLLG